MPDNKENQHPTKQSKGVKKNFWLLYFFFTLGIMVTGYLLSPYGKVNDVHVEGETLVPEQLILESSHVTSKQTVIGTLWNEDTIAAEIKNEFPQIKAVTLRWHEIHDIMIEVEDYKTIAYIDSGNQYQSVLETGDILNEKLPVPRGNQPLLKQFEAGPLLNQFITSFKGLDDDIQNSISEIGYTGTQKNPYTVIFFMNDGNQVKANLTDFEEKMSYYPSILAELDGVKGTIDMEVGVYFTPFEEPANNE